MRIAGLGGEVMRKLGVNAVLTPPLKFSKLYNRARLMQQNG